VTTLCNVRLVQPDDDLARILRQNLDDDDLSTDLLRPVKVPSVVSGVADRLMTAIAIGDYLPGERLPGERELSVILAVSRATLREAIARLQAAGIVEIRRGRTGGAYVRESWTEATPSAVRRTLEPRWAELEQLFDLYGLVEGMVAATAAQRRTEADLAVIERGLDACAAATTLRDEQRADRAFHAAVLAATHNPKIRALSQAVLTKVSLGFPVEPYGGDDRGIYALALAEHQRLREAIAGGDAELARAVATGHFMLTSKMMRSMLERSLIDAPAGTNP